MANDPSKNPIQANLRTYTGPQTYAKARETVTVLTGVPEKFVQYVDDNVRVHLPPESTVRGVFPHGAAKWTRTAIIETEKPDGSKLPFFLKVTHSDVGRINLRGELESMSAIYKATPDFCPMPIATGDYASDPYIHFFLSSFVDMTDEIAEVETLPAKLAQLHMKGTCPKRAYGFHVPTNQGALAMPNTWRSSWECFFSEMMQRLFDWEEEMHGHQEEMSSLSKAIIEKVIPRLLRPLETGGRDIQPCIVHGNLWDGNTSTDAVTDKPVIFDASSAYAHNECTFSWERLKVMFANPRRRPWRLESTKTSNLQTIHQSLSEAFSNIRARRRRER